MKRLFVAGALALAIAGTVCVGGSEPARAEVTITTGKIIQIRNALRLKAEQQPLWARVESILRYIARVQAEEGMLRKVSRQAVSYLIDDGTIQRLKQAAIPLIVTLDPEQRATARRLAHQMGMGDMVAHLN